MSYTSDIPDLVFTTDPDGTVRYTDDPTKPTSDPAKPGEKKWWEAVIGIVPGLVTAIFGGQTANANPNYPPPTQQNTGNNTNIIILAVAAVAVVFLLMKKK